MSPEDVAVLRGLLAEHGVLLFADQSSTTTRCPRPRRRAGRARDRDKRRYRPDNSAPRDRVKPRRYL
jgi:hypothetical protein